MQRQHSIEKFTVMAIVAGALCLGASAAEANIEQIKIYKEAHPGAKAQCILCHTANVPKKPVGEHDLNAYGMKVKATDEVPTAETYKALGKAEDYKEEANEAVMDKSMDENSMPKKECDCDEDDEECLMKKADQPKDESE